MKLNISPPPLRGAPTVVLSAGLGGAGSWLPLGAALEQRYQLVSYDQNGTVKTPGRCPPAQHGDHGAGAQSGVQAAGISRFATVGHALGALIALQLALDFPQAVSGLVLVNGWPMSPHPPLFSGTRAFAARGRCPAWVEAQPLFLYPAEWMAARMPRLEAEDALAPAIFRARRICSAAAGVETGRFFAGRPPWHARP